MKAGKLDRRITFIQAITETGESNEIKVIGWEEIEDNATVNARKIENSGNTIVANDRVTWSQTTSWIVRYRTDLNVRMRVVYSTQVYEILNIAELNDVRKRGLTINTQLLDNIYFT